MPTARKMGLSGNALKCIALFCMLIDHTGYILFPGTVWLRIVGRLAFPIYAYFIAEGCRYTHHRLRHFLEVFVLGALAQVVYQGAEPYRNDIYLNILLTFSVSIGLCYGLLSIRSEKWRIAALVLGAVVLWFVLGILQQWQIDFDYGFWGVLLPPVLVILKDHKQKLLAEAVILCFLAAQSSNVQWWSLLALLPLILYNGTRGSQKLKYVFYLFYPLHLVVLYGIYWALKILNILF